jgi:hypothetical protein
VSPIWIRERIDIFQRFTLASLLNQSFKDFEICLLCGLRNRAITEAVDWHPRVNVIYDRGRTFVSKIKDDYLAISRIDSDDLYRRDALEVIDRATEIGKNGLHYRMCQPPPFVTRVYPRKVYKDWSELSMTLFLQHGQRTWAQVPLLDLPRHLVCVVKHGTNFHQVKQKLNPIEFTPDKIAEEQRRQRIVATEDNEVRKILARYGMTDALIDEAPLIYRDGEFNHGS